MTYDEFWYKNPFRAKAYRKAFEIKQERKQYEIWELGGYFYEDLVNTSVLFRDLIKGQVKPKPYPEKPYGIKEKEKSIEEKEQEAENERLKAKIHFQMLFKAMAKRFENKAGEK